MPARGGERRVYCRAFGWGILLGCIERLSIFLHTVKSQVKAFVYLIKSPVIMMQPASCSYRACLLRDHPSAKRNCFGFSEIL